MCDKLRVALVRDLDGVACHGFSPFMKNKNLFRTVHGTAIVSQHIRFFHSF
jgi:hypothetical protein